jgi:hypothetical protein
MILKNLRAAGREVLIARSGDQKLLLGEKINPVLVPEKWLNRRVRYSSRRGAGPLRP